MKPWTEKKITKRLAELEVLACVRGWVISSHGCPQSWSLVVALRPIYPYLQKPPEELVKELWPLWKANPGEDWELNRDGVKIASLYMKHRIIKLAFFPKV